MAAEVLSNFRFVDVQTISSRQKRQPPVRERYDFEARRHAMLSLRRNAPSSTRETYPNGCSVIILDSKETSDPTGISSPGLNGTKERPLLQSSQSPNMSRTAANTVNDETLEKRQLQKASRKRKRSQQPETHVEGLHRDNTLVTLPALHTPSPQISSMSLGTWAIGGFLNQSMHQDSQTIRLMEHLFDARHKDLSTYRDVWMPILFADEACTHGALAVSAMHMQKLYQENDQTLTGLGRLVIWHRNAALVAINRHLQDLQKAISDEAIAAIIGFACNGGLYNDWRIHMEGLRRIIDLRGGIETFAHNQYLRLMISHVDVAGAAVWDATPYFPWPERSPYPVTAFLPPLPRELEEHTINLEKLYPDCASLLIDMKQVIAVLQALGTAVQQDMSFWDKKYLESGTWLAPLTHRLLSVRKEPPFEDSGSKTHESLRLASLLLLAALRRHIGLTPPPHQHWIDRLILTLGSHCITCGDSGPLMAIEIAAILVIGFVSSHSQADKNYFLRILSSTQRLRDAGSFLLAQEWNECIRMAFGRTMMELQLHLVAHRGDLLEPVC